MIIQKSTSNLGNGKAERAPAAPVLQTDTDFFMTKLAIDEYDFRNEILDKEGTIGADHESKKLSHHGEQEDEIDEEAE